MDSIITSIKKKGTGLLFMTSNGNLYNAHYKNNYYNVFRNERHKKKVLTRQINDIFKMYGYKKLKTPNNDTEGGQARRPEKEYSPPGPSAPEPE
jgi:hypothetical protein